MHLFLSRPLAGAASALALLAALTACSSNDARDLEGLAPGTCTDVRPALTSVDETLRRLADDDIEPRAAADAFKQAQTVVKEASASADPAVADALKELQRRLGFFRISIDSRSADGSQAQDVGKALDALVTVCR